ncbi:hypothetical protein F5984_00720 [Rudanella paleaurantiibacter]|uniref:Uncharacterized protein n=1 Tax=Rudanella paleaurantiibacter TaxID=2614655 RepID=A0A7J5U3U6_9BACT|nr:hypothetical protein [Rudanella paleaurantiibacter]KAB7732518.1 hypothetical protein F5984_00720 [Rudanella paleaurantiibacter]
MKTFLTLFLFPLTTLAQTLTADQVGDRAFKMAKATVEFLATDSKTYGYPAKKSCPDCVSYPSLKTFIREQKLTKADELVGGVERWVANPATAAKDPATALAELRTDLLNRVTSGTERQHRRSLPSFASYEAQMTELSGGQSAPATLAMNAPAQGGDPAQGGVTEIDTAYADADDITPVSATQQADNGWLSKSGLALVLSLLGLALAGWVFFIHRRSGGSGAAPKPLDAATDKQLAQLSDDLFHLKGERNRVQDANRRLEERVAQLESQIAVLQKAVGLPTGIPVVAAPATKEPVPAPAPRAQMQQATTTSAPAPAPAADNRPVNPPSPQNRPRSAAPAPAQPPVTSAPAAVPPQPAPAPPAPTLLYARTVDLGDGFSADSLSEKTSERPMIYQLQIQAPGQATFRVADDPYAQRLALSDPYSYLNDACEYTSQPAPNSRIQTIQPGRLVLQGNKWLIQEKAQIAFS